MTAAAPRGAAPGDWSERVFVGWAETTRRAVLGCDEQASHLAQTALKDQMALAFCDRGVAAGASLPPACRIAFSGLRPLLTAILQEADPPRRADLVSIAVTLLDVCVSAACGYAPARHVELAARMNVAKRRGVPQ